MCFGAVDGYVSVVGCQAVLQSIMGSNSQRADFFLSRWRLFLLRHGKVNTRIHIESMQIDVPLPCVRLRPATLPDKVLLSCQKERVRQRSRQGAHSLRVDSVCGRSEQKSRPDFEPKELSCIKRRKVPRSEALPVPGQMSRGPRKIGNNGKDCSAGIETRDCIHIKSTAVILKSHQRHLKRMYFQ